MVLSPHFFSKDWPQLELDGLVALATGAGRKTILPIWHEIGAEDVRKHSPLLAGLLAVSSSRGLDEVVQRVRAAIDTTVHRTDFEEVYFNSDGEGHQRFCVDLAKYRGAPNSPSLEEQAVLRNKTDLTVRGLTHALAELSAVQGERLFPTPSEFKGTYRWTLAPKRLLWTFGFEIAVDSAPVHEIAGRPYDAYHLKITDRAVELDLFANGDTVLGEFDPLNGGVPGPPNLRIDELSIDFRRVTDGLRHALAQLYEAPPSEISVAAPSIVPDAWARGFYYVALRHRGPRRIGLRS